MWMIIEFDGKCPHCGHTGSYREFREYAKDGKSSDYHVTSKQCIDCHTEFEDPDEYFQRR